MDKRTILDFTFDGDLWPIVDAWAKTTSHRQVAAGLGSRRYQRGYGFWTAPTMLEAVQEGNRVHLEAWVRVGLFARALALFLLPSEMCVQSGGFKGAAPRALGRNSVNVLLGQLGQSPIA